MSKPVNEGAAERAWAKLIGTRAKTLEDYIRAIEAYLAAVEDEHDYPSADERV